MKRAAGAKALRRATRDVVSIAKEGSFEDAGRFRREVRCKLPFQALAPFVKLRQRQEDAFIIEPFDEQWALHHARGVVALALEIFRQRQDPRVAEILIAIECRYYSHTRSMPQLQGFILFMHLFFARVRQEQNPPARITLRSFEADAFNAKSEIETVRRRFWLALKDTS